ncbi:CysZ protein [Microbacterium sp. SORGH_AS 1204]|uniref:EI24 domain-containing protein n=1 Tax=Microbacterium sp. SORGH_AS_1204 TaxID=3041785 RepID=UPI002791FEE1|nr:EI24 domain-containing protein [Microbacterium sp. SORGH_AS_1204]MDQ1136390.1 CysZ protein [Microbacterium sp. SORGH_AS_1204]
MKDFFAGAGMLAHGLGQWRRTPGAMALGLIPGAVVGLVFGAALVAWGLALPGLVDDWTPFAEDWSPTWAGVLRTAIGIASFGAAALVAIVSFTAVTLAIGEPVYDRIWRATERSAIGTVPDADYGFWRAAGDSARLVLRGVLAAAVAWAVGLVPLVGGALGFVTGVSLTGWLLADELTSRALSARGLDRRARRALLRANRARALGFGVATQLCFLVPLGAVAVMPAAVAGSTLWAHAALGLTPRTAGSNGARPADAPRLATRGTGPSESDPASAPAPNAPRTAQPAPSATEPTDRAR